MECPHIPRPSQPLSLQQAPEPLAAVWIPNCNGGTGWCFASPPPPRPTSSLPVPGRRGDSLLFSEDMQLDIPSWLENKIPAGTGGRGERQEEDSSVRTAGRTEAAKSLVSQGLLIQESSEKKLQKRWFQNSKVIFRGKEGAGEKPHPGRQAVGLAGWSHTYQKCFKGRPSLLGAGDPHRLPGLPLRSRCEAARPALDNKY